MNLINDQPVEKITTRFDGVLDVYSTFYTIQGEGPFAGMPAVFIRLAGCNLQCPDCFGTAAKSRIPYVSKSYGPKTRLDKLKPGDVILTLDQDMKLVETAVKSVIRRTVSRWIEIRIDGKTYDVTREHPFFTTRGLIEAKSLQAGDVILEAKPSEIISYKKLGERNPMKDPAVAERSTANTDYREVGRNISKTRKRMFRSGELIPSFYTLSPDAQEECRRKQSEAKRREKNPNWTGKNSNLLDLQELIEQKEIRHCQRCLKKKKKLLVHHKDGNHGNDARNNLAVWCHRCHNRHHERGYNFWSEDRKDGKKLIKAHNGQTVEKVKRCVGSLPVVNLSCNPYNTFLANGMWVHNCDTVYTGPQRHEMTPAQLVEKCLSVMADKRQMWSNFNTRPIIVFTGGEPFRQNFGEAVRHLVQAGFDTIQVETNGTLFQPDFPFPPVTIVCSPKTPHIHDKLKPYIHHLKYVVESGRVRTDNGLPTSTLGNTCGVEMPWPGFKGTIWVQPCDLKDPVENKNNIDTAVAVCLKYGYRLSYQIHKQVGLE